MNLLPSKKTVASLVMMAAGCVAVFSSDKALASNETLSVVGSANITVPPDSAVISLTIEAMDPVPAVARQNAEKPVTSFFADAEKNGIKKEEIKASNLTLYPQYQYIDQKRVLIGYQARRTIEITVSDFSKISKVIDYAMSKGFNGIDDISYKLKDSTKARDEVRLLAVKDAQKKAKSLAEGFNIKLGKVNTINYNTADYRSNSYRMYKANMVGAEAMSDGVYAPDDLNFSDTVNVTYSIDD